MTNPLSTEASAALADLKKKWPGLKNDLQRGKKLNDVHKLQVSTRTLAQALGCSATRIRNLIAADRAPLEDRFLARNGEISTRELLRRSKQAEAKRKAKDGAVLDKKRTTDAQKGAKVICEWLGTKLGFAGSREQVIDETRRILDRERANGTLPQSALPAANASVETIIERTRPPWYPNADAESQALYADWLARWAFFAFPDEVVRDQALNIALDREMRSR